MADTFVKIATVTVGAGGSTAMTFSSIPSTYPDLCLKASIRTDRPTFFTELLKVNFNGVTTNQSTVFLQGDGSTASSFSLGTTTQVISGTTSVSTASIFGNAEIYIPNYAGSTNKSVSSDASAETNSSSAGVVSLAAGLWSNTAAITTVTFTPASGTFMQYSTAYLYGVKNA
jgi:hypothetical protein